MHVWVVCAPSHALRTPMSSSVTLIPLRVSHWPRRWLGFFVLFCFLLGWWSLTLLDFTGTPALTLRTRTQDLVFAQWVLWLTELSHQPLLCPLKMFFDMYLFFEILCVWGFCLWHVYLCTMCVPGVHGLQKTLIASSGVVDVVVDEPSNLDPQEE